ncbi:RNA-binding protein 42 [Condylostylus longicornis]|uniref:RNA-binding protein 42 n=1 Tax=Condylostylus longicornis TaxID=2530218 RepID=UPI00244E3B80|nr:RNA-binding protein 42 [Condylostylus longicornis]
MGTKRKNMEDEISRFEAEISKTQSTMFVPSQLRPVIGSSTFNQVQQKLNQQHHNSISNSQSVNSTNTTTTTSNSKHSSMVVPPPPMPPAFLSTFVPSTTSGSTETTSKAYSTEPSPIVLASAPKLYTSRTTTMHTTHSSVPAIDISTIQFDVTQKLKKLKAEKLGPNPIAEEAIKAAKASSALQSFQVNERRKKDRKTVRIAGGQIWEDTSLADWPDDDFRIFCGDLGNDVNDEVLTRTFNKYPSFQRARVIRDKRTGKSKGFGFVSFREPQDFIKAMKEMDGRYVGSRPIKLRKSTWKQRSLDIVRKKEKEKQVLVQMFQK